MDDFFANVYDNGADFSNKVFPVSQQRLVWQQTVVVQWYLAHWPFNMPVCEFDLHTVSQYVKHEIPCFAYWPAVI